MFLKFLYCILILYFILKKSRYDLWQLVLYSYFICILHIQTYKHEYAIKLYYNVGNYIIYIVHCPLNTNIINYQKKKYLPYGNLENICLNYTYYTIYIDKLKNVRKKSHTHYSTTIIPPLPPTVYELENHLLRMKTKFKLYT